MGLGMGMAVHADLVHGFFFWPTEAVQQSFGGKGLQGAVHRGAVYLFAHFRIQIVQTNHPAPLDEVIQQHAPWGGIPESMLFEKFLRVHLLLKSTLCIKPFRKQHLQFLAGILKIGFC